MTPQQELSQALQQDDPCASLEQLVRRWQQRGMARREAFALLDRARASHHEDVDETRYQALLDVLDLVVGHCRPDRDIWPADEPLEP